MVMLKIRRTVTAGPKLFTRKVPESLRPTIVPVSSVTSHRRKYRGLGTDGAGATLKSLQSKAAHTDSSPAAARAPPHRPHRSDTASALSRSKRVRKPYTVTAASASPEPTTTSTICCSLATLTTEPKAPGGRLATYWGAGCCAHQESREIGPINKIII